MTTHADPPDLDIPSKPTPPPDIAKPPENTPDVVDVTTPIVDISTTPDDIVRDIPDPRQGSGAGGGTGPGVGEGDGPGISITGPRGPLVMLPRVYEGRTPGGIGAALREHAKSGVRTEGAVMNALRWLKKEQKSDGSWDRPSVAMTGFALLCFLAHGETPGSAEFGETVEKALKYLAASQMSWPKRYEWAIATYAMSEAYGMTKIPGLKSVATKGIDAIVRGQRPTGGWCYGLSPKDEADDTSVMGWCAQALKAAKLAGIEHEGLDNAMRKAVKAFKANASSNGGFGYRGPGEGGLTGVGVLCMQLLGAANESEAQRGLAWLDRATCRWDEAWLGAPLYYWYYVTQAKFQAGGSIWTGWDRQFASELVKNQIVLKESGVDGKDIGYWELPKANGLQVKDHSTGLVYNTTLCCLMLEVYYKMLPTYNQAQHVNYEDDVYTGTDVGINVVN
jgi:hypothetical protein